ncbi:4'-phosphopantetheinyl transferase family protein [Hoylesella nanceiensis]|uniref:4'-phosphopantetheinyl transferase family protein n=1 Tax=Hoylesella nanceiensis TaxID=425941 RepID=UPI00288C520C|nr:4'-phosphopantetheinyl transferase superfamily protein [Hoylesella nanceiensis]
MPQLSVEKINFHTTLLVWKITETEEQLKSLLSESVLETITNKNYNSKSRRLEVMATYALLTSYLNTPSVIIDHNSNGQPLLDGFYISISHTNGYACVLLSTRKVVAIDIEYRSDRIERIRSKFLRSDEAFTSIEDLLLVWSAKETLYKYFSEDDLMYNEMKVKSISDSSLSMINLKTNEKKMVSYLSTPDYVLTYLV